MAIEKLDKETSLIVAKKYAQAFINLYSKELSLDLIYNLEKFIEYLEENKKAFFIGQMPIFKDVKKKEIFYQLLKKFNLSNIFQKLINVLIEDKRLILLEDVLKFINALYKEKLNIVDFKIISSHNLTKDEVNEIILFLKKSTGKIINYEIEIDNSLIAGLKIYSKDLGFENSIKKQLSLINATY